MNKQSPPHAYQVARPLEVTHEQTNCIQYLGCRPPTVATLGFKTYIVSVMFIQKLKEILSLTYPVHLANFVQYDRIFQI